MQLLRISGAGQPQLAAAGARVVEGGGERTVSERSDLSEGATLRAEGEHLVLGSGQAAGMALPALGEAVMEVCPVGVRS